MYAVMKASEGQGQTCAYKFRRQKQQVGIILSSTFDMPVSSTLTLCIEYADARQRQGVETLINLGAVDMETSR